MQHITRHHAQRSIWQTKTTLKDRWKDSWKTWDSHYITSRMWKDCKCNKNSTTSDHFLRTRHCFFYHFPVFRTWRSIWPKLKHWWLIWLMFKLRIYVTRSHNIRDLYEFCCFIFLIAIHSHQFFNKKYNNKLSYKIWIPFDYIFGH